MVTTNGDQNLKKAVLDCYCAFWALLSDSEVKFLLDDTSLVKLQNQARRIRTNQFSVMDTEEVRSEISIGQTSVLSDRKAQYLALADFIQNMNRVYEECEMQLKYEIGQKQSKIKNSKELSEKIAELQSEIIDLDDQMHKVLDEITYEYMDNIGKLEKKGEDILQEYKEEVEKINEKEGSALERLKRFKKLSLRQVDIFRDCQSRLQNELMIDCDNELGVKSQMIALQNDLIQAYFEKVKELIEKEGVYTRQFILVKSAKTTAKGGSIISKIFGSDNVSILDTSEQLKKFDEDNYKLTKKSIMEIVEKIKGDVISKIWLVVKNTSNSYKKEIEKDIEGKKMELLLMKREQLIMQIEMNRNNILDYQTMIDEVLKGSQS